METNKTKKLTTSEYHYSFYDISGEIDKVMKFIRDTRKELKGKHPDCTSITMRVDAEITQEAYGGEYVSNDVIFIVTRPMTQAELDAAEKATAERVERTAEYAKKQIEHFQKILDNSAK